VDANVIDSLVSRLAGQYEVEPAEIRTQAVAAFAQFDGVPLSSFVPVLVEKVLRDRLRARSAASSGRPRPPLVQTG
jgi:hypothetical protein